MLLLILDEASSDGLRRLRARAEAIGLPIHTEPAREMRRMAPSTASDEACAPGDPPEVIAMFGLPPTSDLNELMQRPGLVVGLCGLRYPANVGFILRSVEVAGGAGVVLDADWGEKQLDEAFRVGIRPNRFMPVVRAETEELLEAAHAGGRRVLAVETSGIATPWESDWRTPAVLLVGSETEGLPEAVIARCDAIVRIPTRGFIPSYNVQAAVGIMLGEWMRQSIIPSVR